MPMFFFLDMAACAATAAFRLQQQQNLRAWHALKDAPEEMKGDRDVCMAAVAPSWRALEFASQEMKGDRELCTAAVAQNWRGPAFTSPPRDYLSPLLPHPKVAALGGKHFLGARSKPPNKL